MGQVLKEVLEQLLEPEEGISDGDEMPSEPIGRTVPGGGLDGAGVIGEKSEKADLGRVVVRRPGLGLGLRCEAELAGVPHQGAGAGMGVLNPEEGVVLALREKPGGVEIGQIMPGGPKQRPAGGVGPEAGEQIAAGERRRPNDRPMTWDNDSPGGGDKPSHHMSDKRGTHLITGPERNGHSGERIAVPVAKPIGNHGPNKLTMGPGIKGDVEKPGGGDVDTGDPGRTEQPPPQNLSDNERVPFAPLAPLAPGQQQGDIGRVIPTPGPRRCPHLHPLRHGNAQLVVLNGTTHGVQHSAGELGGSHGTSVWEEGGTKANRFRPSDDHGRHTPEAKAEPPKGSPKETRPRTNPKPKTAPQTRTERNTLQSRPDGKRLEGRTRRNEAPDQTRRKETRDRTLEGRSPRPVPEEGGQRPQTRTGENNPPGPGRGPPLPGGPHNRLGITRRRRTGRPLPHQPPYELDKIGGLEGFREEGINAQRLPAVHLILRTRTDDRDGHMTRTSISTQPRRRMQPIESGHHNIESDHIGPHLVNDLQALGTIGRGHDLEALQLEVDPDQLPDDLVVVDDKDPAGQARHILKSRRAAAAASGFSPLPPRARDLSPRPLRPDLHMRYRPLRSRPTHPAHLPPISVHDHPDRAGRVLPVAANSNDKPP